MVNVCVCGGCTNSNLSGRKMHTFPKKGTPAFKSWVRFVQVKRADFTAASVKDGDRHTVICGAHFREEDYIQGDLLSYRMGFRTLDRVRLVEGAVPSIKSPGQPSGTSARSAAAVHKLGLSRTLQTHSATPDVTEVHMNMMMEAEEAGPSEPYLPFTFSHLADAFIQSDLQVLYDKTARRAPLCSQARETVAIGCQAYLTVPRRSVATQLSKRTLVSVRSHGCQTGSPFHTRSIGVGTDNQGLKRSHSGKALTSPPAKQSWVAIAFKDIGLIKVPKKADSSTSEKSSTSIQIDACRDQQSVCLSSLHVSEKSSSSGVVHPKHASFSEHMDVSVLEDVCVNLGCLLQLFQHCERCRGVCAVSTHGDREHFSVLGRCKDCSQQNTWSNQPVEVSDELVNPPDQGKGHMETPEGTGINKRRGKADDTKTEKPFVELEVAIDSDGEKSADENVFGGLEEEEEMEGVSDSNVEDGQQEQGEKENGEIENAENKQLLAVSWPEWDDWQTEDVEDEELKQEEVGEEEEGEEEEEEEEEGEEDDEHDEDWEEDDEHDEDWEEEEEDDDDDEEEHSDSDAEKKSKIKQSRKPRHKGHCRRTPLLCPDCGVTYNSWAHKCRVVDKGPFMMICSECGVRCVSEISLKVHKMDCKGHGRTYTCKYCLKQLVTWEDRLNHEEQSHSKTEKDPYLCLECPQRFSSIKERRLHFKEHKKFICQTCHKQFSNGNHLKRHMLSHSSDNNKPFRCKVCSRAFAQASQLKCHTRIHTGERPYKCQLCPLQFNHNISLKNHVQRHHQKKEHHDDPDTDLLSQV